LPAETSQRAAALLGDCILRAQFGRLLEVVEALQAGGDALQLASGFRERARDGRVL
jgi:hypothetical protein